MVSNSFFLHDTFNREIRMEPKFDLITVLNGNTVHIRMLCIEPSETN